LTTESPGNHDTQDGPRAHHGPTERDYKRVFFELLGRSPHLSAYRVLTGAQKLFILVLMAGAAAWLILDWVSFLYTVNGILIVYTFVLCGWKLWLIDESLVSRREIAVAPEEVAALSDEECPAYTILVPLYHETETLRRLVEEIGKLDYPKDKLDVIFLLEEDDHETRNAFAALRTPGYIRGVVVPDMQPKTKPKACNLGLYIARGKYLVIYDAEDRPEPDQLKKAVIAFGKVDPAIVCIQAKLNFYNPRQNLLTRLFTVEYSGWFDLFLPGLDYLNQPIPLGGTSNHFETARLREIHGWDAFNVTEDCDLGVRLAEAGLQTRMLDSTTWEEACSDLGYWIRQRSRWIKGYVQTYLVHCRRPVAMLRRLGFWRTFGFHMMIGGTPICLLINPVYWVLALFWVMFRDEKVALFFPFPIILFAAACLFVGNFVFVYAGMLAAYRRGSYDLVKTALLMPFYWVLMSIGAWKGFLQLVRRPNYWEKTRHGLDGPEKSGPPEP
jgi:cellulose synthase/poly-beta-1,6-N-acetylglucosamine synthase-like glycosyltransferase